MTLKLFLTHLLNRVVNGYLSSKISFKPNHALFAPNRLMTQVTDDQRIKYVTLDCIQKPANQIHDSVKCYNAQLCVTASRINYPRQRSETNVYN